MRARILSPRKLQALAMVVIGGLMGFAVASSWDRSCGGGQPPDPPPAAAEDAAPTP